MSAEDAAKAIGLRGEHAAARLLEMETGEREPTRPQLIKLAERYRRPILVFYLPKPPAPGTRTHDFRTLPESEPGSEARLNALVRNMKVRQALVKNALEDLEEEEPLRFVGSVTLERGAAGIAQAMLDELQLNINEYRAQRTFGEAFQMLRDAVERIGVYVILMGNLGHYSTNINPKTFRGFALADRVAPFIVINENDSRSAWSFTLLHELAHVFLGQSGISGYDGDQVVERVCDEAAAMVLVTRADLNDLRVQGLALNDQVDLISEFAVAYKTSRKMLAYNLLAQGRISNDIYKRLSDRFDVERLEVVRRATDGGPDYYVVRRHRLGRRLVKLVERMITSGVLTSTKAGHVLGVKPTAVSRLTNNSNVA